VIGPVRADTVISTPAGIGRIIAIFPIHVPDKRAIIKVTVHGKSTGCYLKRAITGSSSLDTVLFNIKQA
jgi:hypothetical protein